MSVERYVFTCSLHLLLLFCLFVFYFKEKKLSMYVNLKIIE